RSLRSRAATRSASASPCAVSGTSAQPTIGTWRPSPLLAVWPCRTSRIVPSELIFVGVPERLLQSNTVRALGRPHSGPGGVHPWQPGTHASVARTPARRSALADDALERHD